MVRLRMDEQAVKEKAERTLGDPTRPLRGHPPLKGEGDAVLVRSPRAFADRSA
jgi:hypothetical protein